jgi:hypothetical protein
MALSGKDRRLIGQAIGVSLFAALQELNEPTGLPSDPWTSDLGRVSDPELLACAARTACAAVQGKLCSQTTPKSLGKRFFDHDPKVLLGFLFAKTTSVDAPATSVSIVPTAQTAPAVAVPALCSLDPAWRDAVRHVARVPAFLGLAMHVRAASLAQADEIARKAAMERARSAFRSTMVAEFIEAFLSAGGGGSRSSGKDSLDDLVRTGAAKLPAPSLGSSKPPSAVGARQLVSPTRAAGGTIVGFARDSPATPDSAAELEDLIQDAIRAKLALRKRLWDPDHAQRFRGTGSPEGDAIVSTAVRHSVALCGGSGRAAISHVLDVFSPVRLGDVLCLRCGVDPTLSSLLELSLGKDEAASRGQAFRKLCRRLRVTASRSKQPDAAQVAKQLASAASKILVAAHGNEFPSFFRNGSLESPVTKGREVKSPDSNGEEEEEDLDLDMLESSNEVLERGTWMIMAADLSSSHALPVRDDWVADRAMARTESDELVSAAAITARGGAAATLPVPVASTNAERERLLAARGDGTSDERLSMWTDAAGWSSSDEERDEEESPLLPRRYLKQLREAASRERGSSLSKEVFGGKTKPSVTVSTPEAQHRRVIGLKNPVLPAADAAIAEGLSGGSNGSPHEFTVSPLASHPDTLSAALAKGHTPPTKIVPASNGSGKSLSADAAASAHSLDLKSSSHRVTPSHRAAAEALASAGMSVVTPTRQSLAEGFDTTSPRVVASASTGGSKRRFFDDAPQAPPPSHVPAVKPPSKDSDSSGDDHDTFLKDFVMGKTPAKASDPPARSTSKTGAAAPRWAWPRRDRLTPLQVLRFWTPGMMKAAVHVSKACCFRVFTCLPGALSPPKLPPSILRSLEDVRSSQTGSNRIAVLISNPPMCDTIGPKDPSPPHWVRTASTEIATSVASPAMQRRYVTSPGGVISQVLEPLPAVSIEWIHELGGHAAMAAARMLRDAKKPLHLSHPPVRNPYRLIVTPDDLRVIVESLLQRHPDLRAVAQVPIIRSRYVTYVVVALCAALRAYGSQGVTGREIVRSNIADALIMCARGSMAGIAPFGPGQALSMNVYYEALCESPRTPWKSFGAVGCASPPAKGWITVDQLLYGSGYPPQVASRGSDGIGDFSDVWGGGGPSIESEIYGGSMAYESLRTTCERQGLPPPPRVFVARALLRRFAQGGAVRPPAAFAVSATLEAEGAPSRPEAQEAPLCFEDICWLVQAQEDACSDTSIDFWCQLLSRSGTGVVDEVDISAAALGVIVHARDAEAMDMFRPDGVTITTSSKARKDALLGEAGSATPQVGTRSLAESEGKSGKKGKRRRRSSLLRKRGTEPQSAEDMMREESAAAQAATQQVIDIIRPRRYFSPEPGEPPRIAFDSLDVKKSACGSALFELLVRVF